MLGTNGEELVNIVWRPKPNWTAVVNVLKKFVKKLQKIMKRLITFGVISKIISEPVVAIPPAFSSRKAIGAASYR